MTDKLPPPLLALFAPRAPLKYLPPSDSAPGERRTARISGVAKYLTVLNTPDPEYVIVPTKQEEIEMRKDERKKEHEKRLEEGLKNYHPSADPLAKGDPFHTLFISRLAYDVTEQDLDKEFGRYGNIERIRIVRDKVTGKSRGYAFIVFSRETDMRAAYKEMNGARINNRRIVIDVERGRTVKTWKPTRLGGGLGGRHYTKAALLRKEPLRDEYRGGRGGDRDRDRDRERFRGPRGGGGGRDFGQGRDYGGSRDFSGRSDRGDREGYRGGTDRDRDRDRGSYRGDRDRGDRDRSDRDRGDRGDRERDRDHDRYRGGRDDRDRYSKRPRYG
ncbi:hypothetical protein V1512DRAFT_107321 [Lipomyces arxii]|uniref:uncharacterized protein n=1 Tax=Lipomyces arxii TaxID=56418 RepID=UPI0034CF70F1